MDKSIKLIRAANVPSSLNTFLYGLLGKLANEYEVIALASPGKELSEIGEREGVRTIAINIERRPSVIKDLVSLVKLIRCFRKEKPDIVHSMSAKCGLLCMTAAWITRVPHRIHSFTGLAFPTATGFSKVILKTTEYITCACANHLLPEGQGVKNDLINNHITKKELTVLGNGNLRGVDMEKYSRRKEVTELAGTIKKDDLFTFIFVGRLVRDKGINELVSAFVRLCDKIPQTRLILVGHQEANLDPIKPETIELIQKCHSIEAPGAKYNDELLAYYAASDCFVFPSYREGFPNVVLEACAMELPCIVTDINGSNEIIQDGINGIIIPTKNEDAIYNAMRKMLTNRDMAKAMSSKARQIVADKWEQSFVQHCLIDFYHSIL